MALAERAARGRVLGDLEGEGDAAGRVHDGRQQAVEGGADALVLYPGGRREINLKVQPFGHRAEAQPGQAGQGGQAVPGQQGAAGLVAQHAAEVQGDVPVDGRVDREAHSQAKPSSPRYSRRPSTMSATASGAGSLRSIQRSGHARSIRGSGSVGSGPSSKSWAAATASRGRRQRPAGARGRRRYDDEVLGQGLLEHAPERAGSGVSSARSGQRSNAGSQSDPAETGPSRRAPGCCHRRTGAAGGAGDARPPHPASASQRRCRCGAAGDHRL